MKRGRPGTRWWWAYGLMIGVPALVLTGLGIHVVDLQRAENLRQLEEQQKQAALLLDSALSTAISDLEMADDSHRPKRDLPLDFLLQPSGTLVFPRQKVYFSEPGQEPPEGRPRFPSAEAEVEAALAAEARSDFSTALSMFRRIGMRPELGAWAELSAARIRMRSRPQALLECFQTSGLHLNGALSPNATPVSLLAVSYARDLPLSASVPLRPFLEETLHGLRDGRWWLGYDQRLLHDTELRNTIETTGGKTATDPTLASLRTVERTLRRLATAQRGSPFRVAVEHGQESILVIARPRGEGEWYGIALAGQDLSGFIERAFAPIRKTLSYPVALVSSNGRLRWGDPLAATSRRSYPMLSVSGWELRTFEPAAAGAVGQQGLWYSCLALLLAMLTFGLLLTTRVVRREMELARLKTEFAAGVTHEFKSPITSIRLLLERITSGRQLSAAALLEYGETMQRETARLERLVNRLLEMHSIQSGEKRYRIAPHRIGDLAAAAVTNLDTHARAKCITVKLDIDDPEYEIDVDRSALEDSLENLLENAIKYSPSESSVSIIIRRKEREISIFVRDEGIGIHPDDLDHIFEQFYRGQNGQTHSVAGTGLGLALVKAAVEGHGGTVKATSTPGQGSEFHISIPMRQEENYVPSVDRR